MIRGDPSGRQHNLLHAEEVYGKEFMKRYRKAPVEARRPRTGESAIANGGTGTERAEVQQACRPPG